MKLSTNNKLIVIIFGIIIITIITYNFSKCFGDKKNRVEGFNPLDPNDWNKLINDAKNAVEDLANQVIRAIRDGVLDAFKHVLDFFNGIKDRFENLGKGINDITNGMMAEMKAIGNMFEVGGKDVGAILSDIQYVPPFVGAAFDMEAANIGTAIKKSDDDLRGLFESLPDVFDPYLFDPSNHDGVFDRLYRISVMYSNCGGKMIKNFAGCFFFYLLNAIGVLLYSIFIAFPVWLIKVSSGIDISCYIDKGFDGLDCVDEFWKGLTGYHLFHYSDFILDKCYYCDGIPHKGIHDPVYEPEPVQPVFQPPKFPESVNNAINNLDIDYNPDNGEIPMRLKSMGRFLGNDTKSVPSWMIEQGIDPIVSSNFNSASAGLNTFNLSAAQLVDDFNNNIPNAFNNSASDLFKGGAEIKAAFQ